MEGQSLHLFVQGAASAIINLVSAWLGSPVTYNIFFGITIAHLIAAGFSLSCRMFTST